MSVAYLQYEVVMGGAEEIVSVPRRTRVVAFRAPVRGRIRVERKTFWRVFGKCLGPNLSV